MIHSFHLLRTGLCQSLRLFARPPREVPGLAHAEVMVQMELGSPIVSPRRLQVRHLAMFAAWESEEALEAWLASSPDGRAWADGWHVRLEFLRRWGHVAAFDGLPLDGAPHSMDEPVVAVTLARMRLPQVPRFLRWGKPVERQVRDDPGQVLALAAAHPLRTVSTFSVWTSARAMTDMVAGRADTSERERHVAAMRERTRKDFHHEFATLRFRCLAEHGEWDGRTSLVPTSP